MKDTEIVIIDDSFEVDDPIAIELAIKFPEANITIRNNPMDGLNYILANLSKKIVVLLDYNFNTGQPKGHDILLRIRNHTSLVYVIIMTAKQFNTIPHLELVDFVNNNALAIVQNTSDTSEILKIVDKAIQQLSVRVDCALEQWISKHSEEDLNRPYIRTNDGKELSLKQILTEIRTETHLGQKLERNIIMLAIDLLTRDKKQLEND